MNNNNMVIDISIAEDNVCAISSTPSKRMGNNLKAIMKVMRITIGRGKSGLNVKELFQMSKQYLKRSQIFSKGPNVYTVPIRSKRFLKSGVSEKVSNGHQKYKNQYHLL